MKSTRLSQIKMVMSDKPCDYCGAIDGMHSMAYCLKIRDLLVEIATLREELDQERALRREQTSAAFDAIDMAGGHKTKRFTQYPCSCGATVSNNGLAAASHLRGTIHRQNLERKAMGLDPV